MWVALVGGLFIWNYAAAGKVREEVAFKTARSFFGQIVITRTWNAQHGGVYVPITEITQPNPYLDAPGPDISIRQNLILTKINPAYMTRQISEIAAKKDGTKIYIMRLLPILPENKPTQRERQALEAFQIMLSAFNGSRAESEILKSDPLMFLSG